MVGENQILIKDSEIVYLETGEIVTAEQFVRDGIKDAKEFLLNLGEIAEQTGIPYKARIVNHSSGDTIRVYIRRGKDNQGRSFKFQKVFKKWTGKLFKEDLGIWEKAAIAEFLNHLYYPYNYLYLENERKHPKIADLAKLLDCKPNKMQEILKKLESLDVIKRIKEGRNNIIYVNPYLYCAGQDVDIETAVLFKNSIYRDGDE